MGKKKEERGVWHMQQAAKSNREHLISVQLPPNAMKKQKTKKKKRNEKKGLQKKGKRRQRMIVLVLLK